MSRLQRWKEGTKIRTEAAKKKQKIKDKDVGRLAVVAQRDGDTSKTKEDWVPWEYDDGGWICRERTRGSRTREMMWVYPLESETMRDKRGREPVLAAARLGAGEMRLVMDKAVLDLIVVSKVINYLIHSSWMEEILGIDDWWLVSVLQLCHSSNGTTSIFEKWKLDMRLVLISANFHAVPRASRSHRSLFVSAPYLKNSQIAGVPLWRKRSTTNVIHALKERKLPQI